MVAFEELKAAQRRAWGAASYEEIPASYQPMLEHVVRRLDPQPGERWLDVGTGTGALAERVAVRGARVTGVDLAWSLLERARRHASGTGLAIRCLVGDVENLPHPEAAFDVVASNLGAIFAPDHKAVAAELARVCRPGGRLALTCWMASPELSAFDDLLTQFAGPRPPGAGRPFDWSSTGHIESLLADAYELEFETGDAPLRAPSAEALWALFARSHGPTRVLIESLETDRREAFHRAHVEFHQQFRTDRGVCRPGPYLLVLGRRR